MFHAVTPNVPSFGIVSTDTSTTLNYEMLLKFNEEHSVRYFMVGDAGNAYPPGFSLYMGMKSVEMLFRVDESKVIPLSNKSAEVSSKPFEGGAFDPSDIAKPKTLADIVPLIQWEKATNYNIGMFNHFVKNVAESLSSTSTYLTYLSNAERATTQWKAVRMARALGRHEAGANPKSAETALMHSARSAGPVSESCHYAIIEWNESNGTRSPVNPWQGTGKPGKGNVLQRFGPNKVLDCIITRHNEDIVQVLLTKRGENWAIPGRFVQAGSSDAGGTVRRTVHDPRATAIAQELDASFAGCWYIEDTDRNTDHAWIESHVYRAHMQEMMEGDSQLQWKDVMRKDTKEWLLGESMFANHGLIIRMTLREF
jgi:hypothetical protein